MKYGTLNFYSSVASIIPLSLITYVITLRAFPAARTMLKATLKQGWVTPESGCVMVFMTFTPYVAFAIAIVGEAASLEALFSGNPNAANASLTIVALIAMILAMLVHPVILGFGRAAAAGSTQPDAAEVNSTPEGPSQSQ